LDFALYWASLGAAVLHLAVKLFQAVRLGQCLWAMRVWLEYNALIVHLLNEGNLKVPAAVNVYRVEEAHFPIVIKGTYSLILHLDLLKQKEPPERLASIQNRG
jgi:hypothetical protein